MCTWNIAECRAPGLQKLDLEEESELVSSGRDPSDLEEVTDLDVAYEELEEMKQRLILLRNKIVVPERNAFEEEVEKEDFSHRTPEGQMLERLRLQKCQLMCRLKEETKHLEETRKELKTLEDWSCLLRSKITQVKRFLDRFVDFKLRVKDQFGLCIERWEHHKTHKVDGVTYRRQTEKSVQHADNARKSVVPLKCHKTIRHQIRADLSLLRLGLHNLFEAMVSDFQFFGRQLSINFTRGPFDGVSPSNAETPNISLASFEE
ncbi:uncharacterized protein LOC108094207 [Drosophila ficusphila]|uniref:uncharacterized protein LOC108094207 n=1 Tax=Drosophila ficusphila TaxID=30025 RepID=UPI0007E800BB|nr:uncharacterized protein LOC108094207 [Drosophila ficusphila]